MGGAVQQRAAGQTAEDHGCHQLVHVHLLWTALTAGRESFFVRRHEVRSYVETHGDTARTSDLLGTSMQEETDLLPQEEEEEG